MRIFNLFFALVFLLFAILQYNDPDPYIWIPLYLYGTVCCWMILQKKYYPVLYLVGIIIYGAYAAYLFVAPDGVMDWIQKHHEENIAATMQATKPWIEETREFFGLIILIVVLTIDFFYARKKQKKIINALYK